MKPAFKTTCEIGTTWELRTVTSVHRPVQYIEMDLRDKTTSEFWTVFHSPLGVPNFLGLPLYSDMVIMVSFIHDFIQTLNRGNCLSLICTVKYFTPITDASAFVRIVHAILPGVWISVFVKVEGPRGGNRAFWNEHRGIQKTGLRTSFRD